jgi:phosphate-selective porin OprO and OprP
LREAEMLSETRTVNDSYLFDYALGVFNGAGINRLDTNEQKDISGRLVAHPVKDLSVGGSFYTGRATLNTTPARPERKQDRDRIGAELAYAHDPISLKWEYITGKDGPTNKDGWYLQAGYFVIPKKLQGVLKFDTLDPDTRTGKNNTRVYTTGVNYYFNKWAFVQVNYEIKDEQQKKQIRNNALTGQLTLQF